MEDCICSVAALKSRNESYSEKLSPCVKSPVCVQTNRAGHSTETALVKDQQKVTQLVLIDLSSAFDTVDRNVLLNIIN